MPPIKDNSSYSPTSGNEGNKGFLAIEKLTRLKEKIVNKTLEDLEKEGVFVFPKALRKAEDIEKKQVILKREGDSYCTGNIMGFLGFEDERLVIESRFCNGGFFLQYLLCKVLGFPNVVNLTTDADYDTLLFTFLAFVFPNYLKAGMRKGLFKKYVRNLYNDGNVKGTIDIARHIRLNTPFTGRIAYSQREFSYDNHVMELVRHTIEFIKGKPYGNKILASVADEVRAVTEATPRYEPHERQKVVEANKKNPVRHAYFHEYRELQRLCLLILQHQRHNMGTGSHRINGILFDGAWLWEEYVNSLISPYFHHPRNKLRQSDNDNGAQQLFSGEKRKEGLIYPDFISKQRPKVIADAKYKPIDNIGGSDYLQILCYMFRFDSKIGLFLYPHNNTNGNAKPKLLHMMKGCTFDGDQRKRTDTDILVIKQGLNISNENKSYELFSEEMSKNEARFTSEIEEHLNITT